MKQSVSAVAASTRVVLPMPASPVMRGRPVPASRCRRTAVSSALRPAIRVSCREDRPAGADASSQRLTKPSDVTLSASTRAQSAPRWETRADTFETVVWETPVSRARARRDGHPARWCRSWSASTKSRCGPMGRLGRGSALKAPPIVQGEEHPSPPQNPLFLPRLSMALPPGTQTAGDAVAIAGAAVAILPRSLACPSREGFPRRRQPRVRLAQPLVLHRQLVTVRNTRQFELPERLEVQSVFPSTGTDVLTRDPVQSRGQPEVLGRRGHGGHDGLGDRTRGATRRVRVEEPVSQCQIAAIARGRIH